MPEVNKLNILYITHYALLYGANRSLLSIINSTKNLTHPIVILPEKGPICELLIKQNIKYYIVPFAVPFFFKQKMTLPFLVKLIIKILIYPFFNLPALMRIHKIAKDNQIQIIHSNTGLVTIGYQLSRLTKLKHIWHLREFQNEDYNLFPYPLHRIFLKKQYAKSSVISVSKAIAKYFSLENTANSSVLYNPVIIDHTPEFHIKKKNYFLFCGLVHKNKGIEELIKVFALFNQSFPDYQLYVLGAVEENYKAYLTGLAQNGNCEKNVLFWGSRDDVFEFMQNARALIMCSRNEAMGRVTVEAMFNKCIVIGYNNAGTAELISNDDVGLLYNDDDELLRRMEYVLKNEEAVTQIEENAYLYAQNNFSESVYRAKIIEIYRKLLQ